MSISSPTFPPANGAKPSKPQPKTHTNNAAPDKLHAKSRLTPVVFANLLFTQNLNLPLPPMSETTRNPKEHAARFVSGLRRISQDRGKLAALRRGLTDNPRLHVDAYPVIASLGGDIGNPVFLAIAAFYATHPDESNARNIGETCRRIGLIDAKEVAESIERRFRRLLALIPTLIFASLIVFVIVRLIPGDIIDLMLSSNDIGADKKSRAQLEAALGLDQPMVTQYFRWIGTLVFDGSLGKSLWQNTSVMEEVLHRLPITFELGIMALLVALVFGIPIGVYSAVAQDTIGDYVTRSFAILALAVPGFWIGTLIMVFPSIWWGWSPEVKFTSFRENPLTNLGQMAIPALILGLAFSAITMRLTRTMMLEVMRQDYIRTALAKGLAPRTTIVRHALRNALIPVVTLIGLQAPVLFGGSVIMEQIFVIPGMGLLLLEAVSQRDYPVITGVFLVVGVAVVLINLLVDLSYGLLDPKVRVR